MALLKHPTADYTDIHAAFDKLYGLINQTGIELDNKFIKEVAGRILKERNSFYECFSGNWEGYEP